MCVCVFDVLHSQFMYTYFYSSHTERARVVIGGDQWNSQKVSFRLLFILLRSFFLSFILSFLRVPRARTSAVRELSAGVVTRFLFIFVTVSSF